MAPREEMHALMKRSLPSDPLERAGSRTQHRAPNHWCHDRISHTRNMPKPRKSFCLWHSLERGQNTWRKRGLERMETSVRRTWQDRSTREFPASVVCGLLNKSNPISILAWRTRSPRDPPLRSYWQMMKTGKWPHVTGEPMAHKYSSSAKQPSQVTRINKQTNKWQGGDVSRGEGRFGSS